MSSTPARRFVRPSAWVLLLIIYLAFVSLGLPDSVLGVAWPHIRETLQLPLEAAGILTLLLTLFSALSSFLSGRLIHRFSTGPIVLVSCLLTGGGLFAMGSFPSFVGLLLAAVPLGFGAGCVDSSLNAFVARHYSSRHMNWLHAFWGMGATVGPVLMTHALASAGGWQRGYQEIAAIQLALAVLFFVTLPLWKLQEDASRVTGRAEKSHQGKASANSKAGWISVAIYLFYAGLETSAGLWANSMLIEVRGVPQQTAGLWVAAYFGAIMVGRLMVGVVSDRWDNRRLALGGLLLCLVGAVLFSIPGIAGLPLGGLILLGLGMAPVYPCLMHETPRRFCAAATSVVIGRQVGAAYVGAALIPGLIGWLAANTTLAILGPVVGLGMATILVLLRWLNRIT